MFFYSTIKRNKAKCLLALAAASFLPYSLTVNAGNCNDSPESGRYYSIVNFGSGMAMDVKGEYTIQGPYETSDTQQFQVTDLGNGYMTIQAINSSEVLAVEDLSEKEGARVLQSAYDGAYNQEWKVEAVSSSGPFTLTARHSGKMLSVSEDGSVADVYQAASVYDSIKSESPYKLWYFNPVDGNCADSFPLIDGYEDDWTSKNGKPVDEFPEFVELTENYSPKRAGGASVFRQTDKDFPLIDGYEDEWTSKNGVPVDEFPEILELIQNYYATKGATGTSQSRKSDADFPIIDGYEDEWTSKNGTPVDKFPEILELIQDYYTTKGVGGSSQYRKTDANFPIIDGYEDEWTSKYGVPVKDFPEIIEIIEDYFSNK
jgi:hypothetical protein